MNGCFYHFTPAFLIGSDVDVQQGPFAPWALPHLIATTDLAVTVPPAVDFPVGPVIRPRCSTDFSMGRGRLLQLLSMSFVTVLSLTTPPECRPASASLRCAILPSLDTRELGLRGLFFVEATTGSLPLRPGDSLTILKMALSVGFTRFVSSADAAQVTGL